MELQVQVDAELAKVRKDLEKEISKTKEARAELEVTVGCLQNMVVSYRISRMQYAPCEENDPRIGRVEDKLTLMVTELLTDLTMAGRETNRFEAEKETLLSRVHNLEAQLATSEQPQYTMESESAEQDRVSLDDEGTSFSGLELEMPGVTVLQTRPGVRKTSRSERNNFRVLEDSVNQARTAITVFLYESLAPVLGLHR